MILAMNMQNKKSQYRSGFTIVELIVVIVVIGILAGIAIVSYGAWKTSANASQLKSDLNGVVAAMNSARSFNNTYPTAVPSSFVPSNGVTISGGGNISGNGFCVTATNGTQSYNISQFGLPFVGSCPVLYYDAGVGASYPGSGTTWTDLSGNGNTGTFNGGVAYNSANGGILNFDGTSGYVSFPNDIVATSYIRTNGVTYSAWVKSTNTASEQRIIGQKPSIGYSDLASGGLGISGGKAEMIAYDDGISYKYSVGGTALQNNTWYYIVGTYDPTDKNIRIYVNGVLDGTPVAIATFDRLTANAENLIGALHTTSTESFIGSISSAAIYNKALSAAEIQQNFNALRSRYGI